MEIRFNVSSWIDYRIDEDEDIIISLTDDNFNTFTAIIKKKNKRYFDNFKKEINK